ncbi:Hormone-sensitive lipase [Halotydeus destructor]|nr:Hormone-sensitive lipase [Halotydeus destructor]
MNTEIDLELFYSSVSKLKVLNDGSPETERRIAELQKAVTLLSSIVDKFDYEDIKLNGFRSGIRTVATILDHCAEKRPQDSEHVLRVLCFVVKHLVRQYRATMVDNQQVLELNFGTENFFEFLREAVDLIDDFEHVILPYCGRTMKKDSGHLFKKMASFVSISIYRSVQDSFKAMTDTSYLNRKAAETGFRHDVKSESYRAVMRRADNYVLSSVVNCGLRIKSRFQVKSSVFNLSLSSKYKLKVDENDNFDISLVANNQADSRPIKCHLYHSGKLEEKRHVIYHVHGGAFNITEPQSHETYLFDFANSIPEAVVISIAYSLSPEARFPVAIQEVLDTYLWLSGKTQGVTDTLGFQPDKILVTGDSAGAMAIAAMLHVMSDIKKQWPDAASEVTYPEAFVSLYGVFDFRFALYPSLMMAILEPLVSLVGWAEAMFSYLPFDIDLEKTMNKKFVDPQLLSKMAKLQNHPYISPALGKDFSSLSGIKLVVVTTTADIFIDDNIRFAKLWKGEKSLVVMDGQPHAFLQMNGISKTATEATQLCIRNIRQSLNL